MAIGAAVTVLVAATATGVVHARQVSARERAANDSLAAAAARTRVRDDSLAKAAAGTAAAAQVRAHDDSVAAAQGRATDSVAAVTPRSTPVVDQVVPIEAHKYSIIGFTVAKGDHCTLAGTVNGVTGVGDFSAFLLGEDDLVTWQANRHAKRVIWEADAVRSTTIDAPIPTSGKYGLVISNQAALLLRHNVMAKVQLRCVRNWPPQS